MGNGKENQNRVIDGRMDESYNKLFITINKQLIISYSLK